VNPVALGSQLLFLIVPIGLFLLPVILGFTVVRSDANRIGERGLIWALLTIPLGWLTILAYMVVRSLLPRR